jgi:hypothetical protein
MILTNLVKFVIRVFIAVVPFAVIGSDAVAGRRSLPRYRPFGPPSQWFTQAQRGMQRRCSRLEFRYSRFQ